MTTHDTLDEALQEISVEHPLIFDADTTHDITEWYGVSNEDGIIAYFGNETDALRFRLDLINRRLNP